YRKEVFECIQNCAKHFSEQNTYRLFEAAFRLYHHGSKEEHITWANLSELEWKVRYYKYMCCYSTVLSRSARSHRGQCGDTTGCTLMRLEFVPLAIQICVQKKENREMFIDTLACFEEEFVRTNME
ncbi:hypothetical protein PFISCL1PPCAC_16779, partial [Pristionchus fissidentatus]